MAFKQFKFQTSLDFKQSNIRHWFQTITAQWVSEIGTIMDFRHSIAVRFSNSSDFWHFTSVWNWNIKIQIAHIGISDVCCTYMKLTLLKWRFFLYCRFFLTIASNSVGKRRRKVGKFSFFPPCSNKNGQYLCMVVNKVLQCFVWWAASLNG